MVILSIIEIITGVVLMILAQKLADKAFKVPGNKGLAGSIFRILGIFLILAGIVLFILFIKYK